MTHYVSDHDLINTRQRLVDFCEFFLWNDAVAWALKNKLYQLKNGYLLQIHALFCGEKLY